MLDLIASINALQMTLCVSDISDSDKVLHAINQLETIRLQAETLQGK